MDRPRLGALAHYPWNEAAPECAAHFSRTLDRLAAAGASVTPVVLPATLADAKGVHRAIMLFEAARRHGCLQESMRGLLSPELNDGLDEGRRIRDAEYRQALARRAAMAEAALDVFEGCDAIVSPPAPDAAPGSLSGTGDPSFCTLWSLAGSPAITIPSGLSSHGLPFGLQLAAPPGRDDRLLAVAGWCEGVISFASVP